MNGGFAGVRVLVTGARGFLGAHLTRRLEAAGAELHCVSRSSQPNRSRVTWWRNDLLNSDDVDAMVAAVSPNVIFHLGGHVTARPGLEHVRPAFESLLASTVWMLIASAQHGVTRFVHVGSATELLPGHADVVPGSPYVAAKSAASGYARMFHAIYELPVVVVRPVMAYGPGQPADKLIPMVIRHLLDNIAPVLGSGRLVADWTYVDDIVDGIFRCGHMPDVSGTTIGLGTGVRITVRELVQKIVVHVRELRGPCPEPVFGVVPDRPQEAFEPLDLELASRLLGWRALTSLDDGLRRTIRQLSERAAD